jgi:hypothetical protein
MGQPSWPSLYPKRRDNGLGRDSYSRSGRFLGVVIRSMGTFHLEGGFLAPASKPAVNLPALLVATSIGVASGTAVFLSLENGGTTETQLIAMPVTKEATHAGVQLEIRSSSRPALNHSSALLVTDSAQATRIANGDTSSTSSGSRAAPAGPSVDNRAELVPKQSATSGAETAVSTNVDGREQAQLEHDTQKQRRLMVHRRRYYARHLANRLLVSPILRPW